MVDFTEWLRSQYGPGTRYPSARQLSLAISGAKNQNAVADLESRGLSRLDTAAKLAEATSTPLVFILSLAGVIPGPDTLGYHLSREEEALLANYRRLSPEFRRAIHGAIRGFLWPAPEIASLDQEAS